MIESLYHTLLRVYSEIVTAEPVDKIEIIKILIIIISCQSNAAYLLSTDQNSCTLGHQMSSCCTLLYRADFH